MSATWKCGHPRTPENTARFGMNGCCKTCREDRLRRQREATAQRRAGIVAAWLDGASVYALAKRHKFTRNHILKILRDAGYSQREPFASDPLFPSRAIKVAAQHAGHPTEMLVGPRRWRELVLARFAYIAAMVDRGASYSALGRRLSRDHSSIMHGHRRAAELRERDPEFVELVERIAAA